MKEMKSSRRSIIFGASAASATALSREPALAKPIAKKAPNLPPPQGYVLGAAGGEHLVHFRNPGNIFIKASPLQGARNLALGTQEVPVGAGIPTHRHPGMDECFYVLEGRGTFILNEVRHPFEKGGTIFIPRTAWHGFENPDQQLLLLWIVMPAGLDAFFRETCNPPGQPKKELTRDQVFAIARKHGTEFK